MKATLSRVVRRGVLAAAMSAAFASSAFALPQFTLDPTAAGFTGSTVTADNVNVSNYSTVRLNETTGSFEERGFLSVQTLLLGGGIANASGLNSTYSLYIDYQASGTQSPGVDPTAAFTMGTIDSLTYTIYGVAGTVEFGFDAGNNVTVTDTPATPLATGALIEGSGSVFTTPDGGGSFNPFASARVSFQELNDPFWASPVSFYPSAFAIFGNTSSQVVLFDGGFRITQGGGAFNFEAAAPIPEPQTYALMLAGLAAMGFVVRRRSGT